MVVDNDVMADAVDFIFKTNCNGEGRWCGGICCQIICDANEKKGGDVNKCRC